MTSLPSPVNYLTVSYVCGLRGLKTACVELSFAGVYSISSIYNIREREKVTVDSLRRLASLTINRHGYAGHPTRRFSSLAIISYTRLRGCAKAKALKTLSALGRSKITLSPPCFYGNRNENASSAFAASSVSLSVSGKVYQSADENMRCQQ